MHYHVKAIMLEEKMGEFHQKLSDGIIMGQKPDGQSFLEYLLIIGQ